MSTFPGSLQRFLAIPLIATLASLLVLVPFAMGWLEPQAWLVNNDHLAPFDYVRQLFAGQIDWNQITHARIPSVWPDYAIAGISLVLLGQGSSSFVLAWLLQFALCIFALYLFLPLLVGRRSALFCFAVAGIFLFSIFVFNDYRGIVFAAGIPARHGGNWINVAFVLSLYLLACRLLCSRNWYWVFWALIFGGSMASVFSNRLFLIQVTAPLFLLYFAYLLVRSLSVLKSGGSIIRSRFSGLTLAVALGSLCGFAQYFFSMHQCEEVPLTTGFDALLPFLSGGGLLEPVWVFMCLSVLFLLVGIYLCCQELRVFPVREVDFLASRTALRGVVLSFLGLSILLNSLAYFSVSEDLFDQSLWRYLLVPAFLAPVGVGMLILPLLERLIPSGVIVVRRSYLLLVGLLGIAGVALESSILVSRVSNRYRSDYFGQEEWLASLLRDQGLMGTLGYVADPPWESRRIEFFSQSSIRALSVSTDGNPRIHPHSRVQFLERGEAINPLAPSSKDVISPSWFLASSKDFDRMKAFWGEPLSRVGCFGDKGCLYLFDREKVKANTSLFLSTWHSEQYGCLRGSAEAARSKGLGLIRQIPVVGRFFVAG